MLKLQQFSTFFTSLNDMPITQVEFRRQTRSRSEGRRWLRLLVRGLLIVALMLGWILAGGEFAGALLYRDPSPIAATLNVLVVLPVAAAFILHFYLMIQTLSLSSDSIARERHMNNWDMLVLTGIDSRKIVRGKWWATVRSMWRRYALLGLLRAAVVIWIGASTGRGFMYNYYLYTNRLEVLIPPAFNFIPAALGVFALTMMNLPFTAACGVSAMSENIRSSALTLARAIGIRLLTILAFAIIGLFSGGLAFGIFSIFLGASINTIAYAALGALIDNGAGMGISLVTYTIRNPAYSFEPTFNSSGFWLPSLLLACCIYGFLTWYRLGVAEKQAIKLNAAPPLPSNSRKPAKMT
jgi:hypothetical protein